VIFDLVVGSAMGVVTWVMGERLGDPKREFRWRVLLIGLGLLAVALVVVLVTGEPTVWGLVGLFGSIGGITVAVEATGLRPVTREDYRQARFLLALAAVLTVAGLIQIALTELGAIGQGK
jgi:hypothetical protein